MRLTAITICYNEEKMIGRFLEHYLSLGVSKFVIHDNMSTDRTVEICNEFAKAHQGCTVEIKKYSSDGQIRDDLYLEIKNNDWKTRKSDFFIVVDVDEFVEVPNSDPSDRKRLIKYLATMKKGYVLPNVLGVQVVCDKFEEIPSNFIECTGKKLFVEDSTFNKRCVFSKKLTPIYKPGCHFFSVNPKDRKAIDESLVVEKTVTPLYLFHLKHVDVEYVKDRYSEFKTRLSDFNKKNQYGHQYEMTPEAIELKFKYLQRYAKTLSEIQGNSK